MTPRHRWLAALGAIVLAAACGGPMQSPAPTSSPPPAATGAAATTVPIGTGPLASPGPSNVPTATPAGPPSLAHGFHYGDILKVQVNSLAARVAPKRSSALVHAYNITGPAPEDKGTVRLNKGDYVSVEMGPLPIGDTTWYLVWPATATQIHPGGTEWYTTPPMAGSALPAWVAASVGSNVYMTLQKRLDPAVIEATAPALIEVAGSGSYESGPLARHDLFNFSWAAAAAPAGTSCSLKVALVPEDGDFDQKVGVSTSTTTVKVGPLAGASLSAPWLPAPEGSWTTFTVTVTSTCNWAMKLVRLEHG